MAPHRTSALLLRAAVAALLFLAFSACATTQPLRPCIESRPAITPSDPCTGLKSADACTARMAYVRRAFASTVYVHASRYTAADGMAYGAGTGEVIDGRGTVLTAYHVIENARLVVIGTRRLGPNGRDVVRDRDIPMVVVATVPALDVALLRPAEPAEVANLPPPFVVRRSVPAAGEELWHFGNVSFWSHGLVGAVNVTYDGTPGMTRADFPCRHGDSGGPFVDMEGRLVGVLLKKDGGEGEGHTFYMPIAVALDALDYR